MKLERIVKTYYDALDEGKILGRKCTRCGKIEFPPLIMCNGCGCQELEWVEISGNAVMTDIRLPGVMNTEAENNDLKPYCYGVVQIEDDLREINAIVCGVKKKMKPELMKKLPVPVKARIVQREKWKTVVFDLVEEEEG